MFCSWASSLLFFYAHPLQSKLVNDEGPCCVFYNRPNKNDCVLPLILFLIQESRTFFLLLLHPSYVSCDDSERCIKEVNVGSSDAKSRWSRHFIPIKSSSTVCLVASRKGTLLPPRTCTSASSSKSHEICDVLFSAEVCLFPPAQSFSIL